MTETPVVQPPDRESPFERLADYVSAAMGRPTNIMVWLVLVVGWTVLFALTSGRRTRAVPARMVYRKRLQLSPEPCHDSRGTIHRISGGRREQPQRAEP